MEGREGGIWEGATFIPAVSAKNSSQHGPESDIEKCQSGFLFPPDGFKNGHGFPRHAGIHVAICNTRSGWAHAHFWQSCRSIVQQCAPCQHGLRRTLSQAPLQKGLVRSSASPVQSSLPEEGRK